jgi:hypothetical protein
VARRRPGTEVIGIDPDPAALRRAHHKADQARPPMRLERAFAGELPLPDGSVENGHSSNNVGGYTYYRGVR